MCKKIKWLLRIINSQTMKWNTYSKYCISISDNKYHTPDFLLKCSDFDVSKLKIPKFYITCLQAWQLILRKNEIIDKSDVLNQNLFGNHLICKRGNPIVFVHWMRSNIYKTFHKHMNAYELLPCLKS